MLKNSSMNSHLELCLHHYLLQLQHNTFVYKLKWCLQFLLISLPFLHNKHLVWWPLARKWSFSAPKRLYTTKIWLIIYGNVIFTIYSYVLHNFENSVCMIPRCENRWSFAAQKILFSCISPGSLHFFSIIDLSRVDFHHWLIQDILPLLTLSQ